MKLLRFAFMFAVALVTAVCVLNCVPADDIVLPSLPCRDGGHRTEDGKTVFDVPLNKLVGAPSVGFTCRDLEVRTAGYLCVTEGYGPFLFESDRVAEQYAWMVEPLAFWDMEWRPSLRFEEGIALWLPMEGLEQYNGHHVTVEGVYRQVQGRSFYDHPTQTYLLGETVALERTDPMVALAAPIRIPLCSGPRPKFPMPGTIQ